MGLITETNAQYYSGQQPFTVIAGVPSAPFKCTFNTVLTDSPIANYIVTNNNLPLTVGTYSVVNDSVTITASLLAGNIVVQLIQSAIDRNNGGYEYVSLNDIINNFMVAYIGVGKLIPSVKRTDIMFHAKRGLQEFSYDTLRSMKSQELTIPASLSLVIPQDYVNYVNLSWIDQSGVKHIIYPTTLTSNPTDLPIQDVAGIPSQGGGGANLQAEQSETETRWASNNSLNLTMTRARLIAGVSRQAGKAA